MQYGATDTPTHVEMKDVGDLFVFPGGSYGPRWVTSGNVYCKIFLARATQGEGDTQHGVTVG